MYLEYREFPVYGTSRWVALFKITEPGPFLGLLLPRFYNVPKGPFLPRTHNLWADFTRLIGRRPPTQGLTPDDFLKGTEVLVATVTVTEQVKGKRRIQVPEDCLYSKIDELKRITAGCPPCQQSR